MDPTPKSGRFKPMPYPRDFLDRVLAEFPGDAIIKTLVDSNGYSIGAYLEANSYFQMGPGELTAIIRAEQAGKLLPILDRCVRIKGLHIEWCAFVGRG